MFEWKWLELAFFPSLPAVGVAKKTRSSCFKHLQMLMYQQLVSVQLSYCRGIKKTGRSWRWTANLPCSVGEHFPWKKKGLIFLQRSTGRFSRGVSASLGRGGRVGWRAKCFSDREAWSRGSGGGWGGGAEGDLSAQPCHLPARDTAHTHTHRDVTVPCVWVPVSPDCRLVHEMRWPAASFPLLLCVSALSCQSITPFLSLLLRPRRGKRKPPESLAFPSLSPHPLPLDGAEREDGHPTASSCSSSQSPVWGFVHLRKL